MYLGGERSKHGFFLLTQTCLFEKLLLTVDPALRAPGPATVTLCGSSAPTGHFTLPGTSGALIVMLGKQVTRRVRDRYRHRASTLTF